jgi:hypothetical protein
MQHYMIKFISDMRQVSSTNNTESHAITEIVLKVTLNLIIVHI